MKLKELIIVENKKRTCNASSYISTENMISNYGGVVLSNSFNLVKGTLFNKNYILLSNIRPYFRKILFSNFEGCCSNDVLSIKVDSYKCDPKYLYYFFCSDGFINNYVSNCKGTKMPRGDKIYLLNLNFNLPNIEVQQHIVNTIGTIDDLIEKNDLILQKFCSFKDHLYDLTAQKSNSTCSLGELITRKGQLLKNKEWISNKVLDLSTMKSNNIFIETFSPGANFSTNIKSIENYDLVYGSIRPYFKKCGFALDVDFVAGSVYSFDVIDDSFYLWVLSAISNESFHLYTSKNSQGTKMPIINWDVFCKYMLPIPGSSDLEKFNKAIDPLFKNCCNIMRKNKELIKIKARLLDKYF